MYSKLTTINFSSQTPLMPALVRGKEGALETGKWPLPARSVGCCAIHEFRVLGLYPNYHATTQPRTCYTPQPTCPLVTQSTPINLHQKAPKLS